MKIVQVASPHNIPVTQSNEASAKARAIEAFNKASAAPEQAQEHPVQNPSNVSVEELGAIQTRTQPTETTDNNTVDETPEVTEATETPRTEQKDPALSRQFAQLARQERQLRAKAAQQEQAIKAREAALQAREAELAARDSQYKGYISPERLKQDALGVLEEQGLSYDEVTQQALTRQPTDPRVMSTIQKLEAKIAELEKSSQDSVKNYQEQQQAQYQAAVKQIRADATDLVKSNPEEYEAIAKTGSIKDVVELIERTYKKDGVVLSVEEAAQEVENYLIEEGINISRIGKIKRRLEQGNASQARAPQQTQANKQQTQPGMKTLTNATSSSRKLSAKERAVLAFKGELKS